jgi:hypothetical protein
MTDNPTVPILDDDRVGPAAQPAAAATQVAAPRFALFMAEQTFQEEAEQAELRSLRDDYGGRWQIQHQLSPECWTAVRRPEPSQVIIKVAHDLAVLRAKIAAAETELAVPE